MRNFFVCIFLLGVATNCFSQKITGTVTDSLGNAVPFASIFVKGTQKGTNANNDGKYLLDLPAGTYILVCQSVDFKKEEKVVS